MEIGDILAEIYGRIDLAEVLRDLNPAERRDRFVFSCPSCGQREGFVYKGTSRLKCNRRNRCGFSRSLWDYIKDKNGLDQQATLLELARLAHYHLPELNLAAQKRTRELREREDLLEKIQGHFESQLWKDDGRPVLEYLGRRGYNEEEITAMELGFFPSQAALQELLGTLISHTENPINLIQSLGLDIRGFGDTHLLTIPYRDPSGHLKGFQVRRIDQVKEDKYLNTRGLDKGTLFNLHRARASRITELILVEGILDALIAEERGVPGVVATGGAQLTQPQFDNAFRLGVKRFTLALDNDEAGRKGTEKTLDLLNQMGLGVFVVALPRDFKDPGDLIKDQGIEVFHELVRTAQSGAVWRANRILSNHDLVLPREKRAAIEEALAFAATLNPIDRQDFQNVFTRGVGLGENEFEESLTAYRERIAQERVRQGYLEFSRGIARHAEKGEFEQAQRLIDERGGELIACSVSQTINPYTLSDLQAVVGFGEEGLRTGYETLDRFVVIPQGAITIIAGRPSHGKTTFLLNLLLNMARSYPDKTFFFFSYEENKRPIALKVLNILTGLTIDPAHNMERLESYLRSSRTDDPEIEQGKNQYAELLDTGRILLSDEPFFVDDLTEAIRYHSDHLTRPIGAVFIDYIQKIKYRGKTPTRQVELQKVSEHILETAKKMGLPIVMGCQLGRDKEHKDKLRLDNLREAGDIEQDANLVLGLFNPAMEKAQEDDEPIISHIVDLKVELLKNRNGQVNRTVDLKLDLPILTIRERTPQEEG